MQVVTRLLGPMLLAGAGLAAFVPTGARADEIASLSPTPAETMRPSGGGYSGVSPGASANNPLPQPPPGASPYLIWTGFQPTGSGSRVFIQTTAPVEFEVEPGRAAKGKSVLTVVLRGCRIHMANNRRNLDTRAFPTPVQGVSAKQHGANVDLHIALREEATVTSGTEPGPGGSRFLVLDFPPGKAAPIERQRPIQAQADLGAPGAGEGWAYSDEPAAGSPGQAKPQGRASGKATSRDKVSKPTAKPAAQ